MALIHSFCMNKSNKIYDIDVLNKTKTQKTKKRNAQVSQKFAFMLKNVNFLVFISKD